MDLAAQAVGEITGDEDPPRLPSGALHDAAEVARRYPTVMVFSSSIDGVSHNPTEDTPRTTCASPSRPTGGSTT